MNGNGSRSRLGELQEQRQATTVNPSTSSGHQIKGAFCSEQEFIHHVHSTHSNEACDVCNVRHVGQKCVGQKSLTEESLLHEEVRTDDNSNKSFLNTHLSERQGNPSSQRGMLPPISAFALVTSQDDQEKCCKLFLIAGGRFNSHSASTRNQAWLKLGLGITEIAGEAGSGKSQIAMSLCVRAVLQQQHKQRRCRKITHPPNCINTETTTTAAGRAIFISLSGGRAALSRIAHRMQQMANALHMQLTHNQRQPQIPQTQQFNLSLGNSLQNEPQSRERCHHQSLLSQILTLSIRNQEELFTLLHEDLPVRLENHQVAIIVLDSIADLYRLGNGDETDSCSSMVTSVGVLTRRSSVFFEIAKILRGLSHRYRIPVLVINQVSSDLNRPGSTAGPSLGMSWANCVNASYFLRRSTPLSFPSANGGNRKADGPDSAAAIISKYRRIRHITLTKSSVHAVHQQAAFEIKTEGAVVIDP